MTKIITGVVGAGTMGAGIAQLAATNGHKTFLFDKNPGALQQAEKNLKGLFEKLVMKEKISKEEASEIFSRITFTSDLEQFASCNFIVEAIVEDLKIKQQLFRELESIIPSDSILSTNTSSLSVTAIASACENPGRVIGIHFFNPAPLMPLVEIIPSIQTSEETFVSARGIIDSWGKITVKAKDTPGFIVNRVARPFYGEAIRIFEEGIASRETIDWAMKARGGFRMGPFELMDFIGNDVNYAVTESVFKAFYYDPRYRPSFTQKRLVEAGWLGRKTGMGHYNYKNEVEKGNALVDESIADSIVHRILSMLINEAADALYLNIASKEDLDLAMTKGVNYPKGLLAWADEMGISNIVEELKKHRELYMEDRYRISPILSQMAASGKKFYQ